MNTPLISPRISFKEFKERAYNMHKFGQIGFVLLYEGLKNGWKYKINMLGSNKTHALQVAYYHLYGNTTDLDKEQVRIAPDEDSGLKMPISMNFGNVRLSADEFTANECKELMK